MIRGFHWSVEVVSKTGKHMNVYYGYGAQNMTVAISHLEQMRGIGGVMFWFD
jgi:hypothetical protein